MAEVLGALPIPSIHREALHVAVARHLGICPMSLHLGIGQVKLRTMSTAPSAYELALGLPTDLDPVSGGFGERGPRPPAGYGKGTSEAPLSLSSCQAQSVVISTGATFVTLMACSKNRRVAFTSRRGDTNTSMTWPNWSI